MDVIGRKNKRQTSVLWEVLLIEIAAGRATGFWHSQLVELKGRNLTLTVLWDSSMVDNLNLHIYVYKTEIDSWTNFKPSRPKVSQNQTEMAKNTQAYYKSINI